MVVVLELQVKLWLLTPQTQEVAYNEFGSLES